MINFTVYSADCVGNSGNCLYPKLYAALSKKKKEISMQMSVD